MPTSETPTDASKPNGPEETGLTSSPGNDSPVPAESLPDDQPRESAAGRGSRWVDYDTHELLEMISELEDERRFARLREGIWLAILLHLLLLSAITWIPKYIFQVPRVIDPIDAINQRKDLTYLDVPPDALRRLQPKVAIKPVPSKPTVIDKKTLEEMNRPKPPEPAPTPAPQQAPAPQAVQPTPPPPSTQQPQIEAPHPAAVPARPNFAMGSANPNDQLRDAMKGSNRNANRGGYNLPSGPGLAMHPGAGSGGVEVLSDMQGVDFSSWLLRWHNETQHTWDPLIPDEVNPPIYKKGQVLIRFKVLPNGRLMDGSMKLEGTSGDVALDRAAWGALTGSNYAPLPRDFHGPYLELRALFMYNMETRR
jgi:hypothetical protein